MVEAFEKAWAEAVLYHIAPRRAGNVLPMAYWHPLRLNCFAVYSLS